MKVLLVNYEYPGVTVNCGGGGRVTKRLKAGLEELGHEVVVVTDDADKSNLTFPFRTYKQVDRHLATGEFDVINGHFAVPSSLLLPYLSRKHNVPYAVSVMGADIHDPTRYSLIRPALNTAVRRVLDQADAVIAPSTDMHERTDRLHPGNTHIIHYGIDMAEWSRTPSGNERELNVLTVARLVKRKNLSAAIGGVRKLRNRGADAQYRIVGTGPRKNALQRGSKMPNWLDFRGYVDDIHAEYEWGDVFLLPSKHEAFGIVFLEALASGVPVVTTRTGGQIDIVQHGESGQIRSDSPDELATGLQAIWVNYGHYHARARQSVVPHFTTERMAAEYAELYESLL